ncbi:MAG TPA: LacI family DNA-binding transcriptional regulator [Thermoanaerobaculaceae bacterium]|nr:LacI family DNA-binding transcriptional regulator [Thermoanaerobaculaceae bacterium]
MYRPTRNDVAKLAKVSSATVSYVLNNGPRPVSKATRARVQAAIKKLKYHPHAVARSLSRGRTQTVGFLAPSLLPAFQAHLVDAVEENLARRGYGLIIASSHEDSAHEIQVLNTLVSRGVDGLLLVPTSSGNVEKFHELVGRGLPLVFVDRYVAGVPADVVTTDNVEAARHATHYLLHKGCKRLLCISFSQEASSAIDRVKGFREALSEHGLNPQAHPVLHVRYAAGESVSERLRAHLARSGAPDGILCTTDGFVIETVRFLRSQGIPVPGQTQVTGGFFVSGWNEILDPPLAIVSQNFRAIADHAVRFLLERIEEVEPSPAPRIQLVPATYLHE